MATIMMQIKGGLHPVPPDDVEPIALLLMSVDPLSASKRDNIRCEWLINTFIFWLLPPWAE
jgi:hypothetical protein